MQEKILDYLTSLNIPYQVHRHPAVFTADDANQFWRTLRGAHCKNIFVRNRGGDRHFLVTIPAFKQVDLQALRRILNVSKLSFGSHDRLMHYLGVTPGSVSPFGLLADTTHKVEYILDEELLSAEYVNFHPNENTITLELTPTDFLRFVESTGHTWQKIAVPSLVLDS